MNSLTEPAPYRLLRYDAESPDERPDGDRSFQTLAGVLRTAADLSENGNGVYQVSLLHEGRVILTFFPELGDQPTYAVAMP